MSDVYFFDSYAVIEVLRGNKNYAKYLEADIITTQLTLFEVYYALLKHDVDHAEKFIKRYEDYTVSYTSEIIRSAARLKFTNKKKNLSMTDCIGYALALDYGIKFLTGDKEFKDMKNVEYVK